MAKARTVSCSTVYRLGALRMRMNAQTPGMGNKRRYSTADLLWMLRMFMAEHGLLLLHGIMKSARTSAQPFTCNVCMLLLGLSTAQKCIYMLSPIMLSNFCTSCA